MVTGPDPGPFVQGFGQAEAIARALEAAAAAGRWDVVALLAEELRARRLEASGNVVALPSRKRGPP